MKYLYKLLFFFFPVFAFFSCEEEADYANSMPGLWKQVSVTEDGTPMALTPEQESCRLLIEANGIYRCYHKSFSSYNKGNGPTSFYGTWSVLDDKWVNLTTDKWKLIASVSSDSAKVTYNYKTSPSTEIDTTATLKKQWSRYHIQSRFTILKLTDTEMEIRMKTFVGEKKYAMIFAPDPSDFMELKVDEGTVNYSPGLVTDQNYWTIQKEFRTLKTYVFKFEKETY